MELPEGTVIDSIYPIYEWNEDGLMYIKDMYVSHAMGQSVTRNMVLETLREQHLPAGRYRTFPKDTVVDFEVTTNVELKEHHLRGY